MPFPEQFIQGPFHFSRTRNTRSAKPQPLKPRSKEAAATQDFIKIKKNSFCQALNPIFPEAIDEATYQPTNYPLLKRINESLLSPKEVVTLSYRTTFQSKLLLHTCQRHRFPGTSEARSDHGHGP
jgi:hypothetical protein